MTKHKIEKMLMKEVPLNDDEIKKQKWNGIKKALPILQDVASEALTKYIADKAYFDFSNAPSKSRQVAAYDILNKQMRNIPSPSESELAITKQKVIDTFNKFNATIHLASKYLELKSNGNKATIPENRQKFVKEHGDFFKTLSKKMDDPRIISQPVIQAGVEDVAKKVKAKHRTKNTDNTFTRMAEDLNATLGGIGYNIGQTKNIVNKAADTINTGGSLGQVISQAKAIMNDESEVFVAVLRLRDEIVNITNINSGKIPVDTKNAAGELVNRLNSLLSSDKQNTQSKAASHQFNLATVSIDAIDEFRPRLESAPGFWNQLQAKINIFVEKVFGIKDCLGATEGTAYSGARNVKSFKDEITALKDKHDPDLQMEDYSIQPKR